VLPDIVPEELLEIQIIDAKDISTIDAENL
jgi:hypothetical protein